MNESNFLETTIKKKELFKKDDIIKLFENKTTLTIDNKQKYRFICINMNKHFKKRKRCDYLIIFDTKKYFYFIELKASDYIYGIEQLGNTINFLEKEIETKFISYKKIAIIVSLLTIPKTSFQKFITDFKNDHKTKLMFLSSKDKYVVQ